MTLEEIFEKYKGGIRIPRIQRGYVQGRDDEKGTEIRANFVPTLVDALVKWEDLSITSSWMRYRWRCSHAVGRATTTHDVASVVLAMRKMEARMAFHLRIKANPAVVRRGFDETSLHGHGQTICGN